MSFNCDSQVSRALCPSAGLFVSRSMSKSLLSNVRMRLFLEEKSRNFEKSRTDFTIRLDTDGTFLIPKTISSSHPCSSPDRPNKFAKSLVHRHRFAGDVLIWSMPYGFSPMRNLSPSGIYYTDVAFCFSVTHDVPQYHIFATGRTTSARFFCQICKSLDEFISWRSCKCKFESYSSLTLHSGTSAAQAQAPL